MDNLDVITAVWTIAGFVFAAIQGNKWFTINWDWKKRIAFEILKAACGTVYENWVKDAKNAQGTLTPEQRTKARAEAIATAKEIGKAQNIDIEQLLGEPLLDHYIGQAVKDLRTDRTIGDSSVVVK